MTDDPHAEALAHLRSRCARIAAVIDHVGPCTMGRAGRGPLRPQESFAAIAEAIVSQQLSPKAASTIFGRVAALGPKGAFPKPNELLALEAEALRGAGLSGAKTRAVRDLAERVSRKSLRLERLGAMSDDEVIAALSEVRGIGRWTAEMFLMFQLDRKDILPLGDLGVQKGIMNLFKLRAMPSPDEMVRRAKPWRPFRSIACFYLWRMPAPKP